MSSLDAVNIPLDLVWVDEMEWEEIEQGPVVRTVTGALEINPSVKLGGRPITLKGTRKYGLATRKQVLDLKALSAVPEKIMVLTVRDGRTFNVTFASGSKRVYAKQLFDKSNPRDSDYCVLELYLMEVIV